MDIKLAEKLLGGTIRDYPIKFVRENVNLYNKQQLLTTLENNLSGDSLTNAELISIIATAIYYMYRSND